MTPKWAEVEAKCLDGINSSLSELEARGLAHDDTQFERGRIAALRDVLALNAKHKEPDLSVPPYI